MSTHKEIPARRAVLGAAILALAGAMCAAVCLVFKQPVRVGAPPDNPPPGAVYFVEGKTHAAAKSHWAEKRRKINSGRPYDIELREQELNAWMASAFGAEEAGVFSISPGVPNFRVAGGELQLAMPFTLAIPGVRLRVLLQTRGTLVREKGGFALKTSETRAGSLPLHWLGDFIVARAAALIEPESGIRAAWKKLSVAEVNGDVLHLVSP
ncbi:MAG: hypothetical protein LBR12_00365 [Opitutaceae bacterium]|jgi:hypothetical protein|nr:hypothetical protein [Opitutaceae bacterium]